MPSISAKMNFFSILAKSYWKIKIEPFTWKSEFAWNYSLNDCRPTQKQSSRGILYKMWPLKVSKKSWKNISVGAFFLIKLKAYRCFPMNFAKFLRTPFLESPGDCLCSYSSFTVSNKENHWFQVSASKLLGD